MMRSARLALALAAAAAVPAPAPARAEGGPPPQAVLVEEVRAERIGERRRVTGTVRAVRRSLVAAREPGIVLEVLAREGAAVKAGQALARIDVERLRLEDGILGAEAVEAAAAIEEREAAEAKVRRDLEAVADLASRGAARPKEPDDAATAVAEAAARTRFAKGRASVLAARRALLARRIADAEVKAPFDGAVASLRTEAGAWAGEGEPLFEVVSTGDLEARLDVPERSLAPLRGLTGSLRVLLDAVGAERDLDSWRIVGEVDPASRTFPVLAPIAAGPGVAPGMSVSAFVPTGADADVLTVSRDALLRSATGTHLFVASGGGEGRPATAVLVPVEVLFSVGERAAVRGADLAAGALAVVEGNERLFPGAPLLPAPAAARPAGGGR